MSGIFLVASLIKLGISETSTVDIVIGLVIGISGILLVIIGFGTDLISPQ